MIDVPPAALESVDFERDVASLLERRCLSCHSSAARKGELSLESAEELAAGGRSGGPLLVAGDAEASLLLEFVSARGSERPRMPKGAAPLADEEVARLRAWIEAGAPWPEGRRLVDRSAAAEFEQRRDWWSLRPLTRPAVPALDPLDAGAAARGIAPARNEVDAFVRAALRAAGLEPAAEADRRTLVRRATWQLTGLPPTPEEVAGFLADDAHDAFERLVDRLLASPRSGERFARPWLDLVHWGETHGFDKDKPRPNAWPYRDWVIAAFDADLPYARFLEQQLAGDVLYPGDPDALVATGFLAAGPWDYVGHVELREGTLDKAITRNLDRDDMVTTALSTFASATVHCARCHDHKFDAIAQEDYYALQAVFAGIDRAERTFDRDPELAARRAALERRRTELAGTPAPPAAPSRTRLGWHSALASDAGTEEWLQVDLGAPTAFDQVVLVPAHEAYGGWPGPGFGFPPRFRIEVADEPGFARPRLLLDRTGAEQVNPGDAPLEVACDGTVARYVRVTATRLWERTGDFAFALGELAVLARGVDVARGRAPAASSSIEAPPRWSSANATDGLAWRGELDDAGAWLERAGEAARVEAELAALPLSQRVYAGVADFAPEGAFTPPGGPRPIHLLARGDVASPQTEVGAGALRCVAGLPARFDLPPDAPEGARRAALARWLADPRNPLTWRSIVNRVWQWHFGRGIVDTPNDFGRMGGLPSHPELLDWLAGWLVDHGGSLRELRRLLVTSSTWRQTSLAPPATLAADGGNRLLGRSERARLDAEQLRDGLLAISGRLDPTAGGPSERHFTFKDDHSPVYDYAGFDPDAGRRRSIYRFLVRSAPDPWMECLDCPDASLLTPQRSVTITALQALALLNDPFVLRQCEHLAARAAAEAPGDVEAQVARAFELALARPPAAAELAALAAHARAHGVAAACRVVVNLDEFLFLD